jgi:HEAT repeat protein
MKFLVLNVVNVLVAEFREPIRPAIPQIISLLSDSDVVVRRAAADALSKLSEQGKVYII